MKKIIFTICILCLTLGSTELFAQQQAEINNRQNSAAQLDIKYYPNPVVDQLTIEVGDEEAASRLNIRILNLIGSEMKLDLDRSEPGKVKLNVADFPTGYYMVSVRDDANRSSHSFRILKK
jgi:hypothetical protein